jgi:predicted RNA-binding protein with EMAP domain
MILHEIKYELCRTERGASIITNGEAVRKRAAVAVAYLRVRSLP